MKLVLSAAAGVMLALMVGASPGWAVCTQIGTIVRINFGGPGPTIEIKTNSLADHVYTGTMVFATGESGQGGEFSWLTTMYTTQTTIEVTGDADRCPIDGESRELGDIQSVAAAEGVAISRP